MSIAHALEILKHRFGYDSFRMNQQSAIQSVLDAKNCVVLMPTGGGKSLCYQIPALMMEGLTVVVSPLISLMKDQTDALKNNGVEAVFLNSTQTDRQQVEVFQSVRNGKTKLLYVAPERLFQSGDRFIDFLKGLKLSLFAIDEAHCISSWGHDFRPEYLQLAKLKTHFPNVPLIALTATADKLVRKDIVERLNIPDAEVFVSSFNRPNIFYRVEPKRNSYPRLLDFLDEHRTESGIIYCLSRNSVESLASDLRDEGFDALPYHAGFDKQTRDQHQDRFLNDEVKIIVATIAFGMGIDKPDVRFVVHMDLPKNIESYYQETGRAGRDRLPSEALLFYTWADVLKLKSFVEIDGNPAQTEIMLRKLEKMAEFGGLKTCRRRFLLNYFSEEHREPCQNCDNCTTRYELFDGTIIAQKALSAVYRTGQRFGINYLIDLLRGSGSAKIRDEHKSLKTYGVAADISKENWFEYFRDLIAQGFLAQTDGQYPVIVLTERSDDVLKRKTRVELIKLKVKEEKKSTLVPEVSIPYHRDLFDELRQLRTAFAKRENVPPYVIFSDSTLIEMAAYLPQNEADMRRISGVGDTKLEKYGRDFLKTINAYRVRNKLDPQIHLNRQRSRQKSRTKRAADGTDTYQISLEMFRSGLSIKEIAESRAINTSTVENHLARFISTGKVELHELVPESKIGPIREAVVKFNHTGALSPVKEFLGDDYSYGEIKAVIAAMQMESK